MFLTGPFMSLRFPMLRTEFVAPLLVLTLTSSLFAQRLEMPRRHDRPPGPPVSAEEAVAKMTVPEGFTVEIVAAEPQIMNPVAMCIDEKGRYWITESFEYPRREPGLGRDRIKVLEDTDGDGRVDNVSIFAEGLNIPSGIAVGYGGVWVANAPDILFLQDTDGDLKADKQEVIVTGFGRDDTHELPNSFTWGPDGWLYGLNGVFNFCDIKYSETNPNFKPDHPGWKFTCAMFRIHPRTREFQVFAEGTSNPWGIAINDEGDFFISACVIEHLWHIVETGYYIRQGGPYPPHTWPIESIVDHQHQKAAYCGITWFDSDCYPAEYRRVLYMGNIHGGCINADVIARHGATYKGKAHPGFAPKPQAWNDDEYGTIAKMGDATNPKLADLLTANDPWFMPVVQTTGPDGCLYILDWYDRYHCYQDANADPEGIERERGRLYRLRYKATPHAMPTDLAKKSDDDLIALLGGPNEYVRHTARRLLNERNHVELIPRLLALAQDGSGLQRRHALYTLMGFDLTADDRWMSIAESLCKSNDPVTHAWGLRCLSNHAIPLIAGPGSHDNHELAAHGLVVQALEGEGVHPAVRLQAVIFIGQLLRRHVPYAQYADALLRTLTHAESDPLLKQIVWVNLQPLLDRDSAMVLTAVKKFDLKQHRDLADLLPRIMERMLDKK
jgi:putative membrane-bound dehydrogenase-like protein